VAQGTAFAADLPVVPVSTLAALAQRAYGEKGERFLLPAYDARMGELYWAAYQVDDQGLVEMTIDEAVARAESVCLPQEGKWFGVGSGWGAEGGLLQQRMNGRLSGFDQQMLCSAREIALLAEREFERGLAVSPEQALPVYLRNQVAQKSSS
jgi:tRNA threonylcarbamoyladenosine biosynthesis protein TsaB